MLPNLRAEMVRIGIKTTDIARAIGKTERSVRYKVSGQRSFSVEEALTIRDSFFPGLSVEYLFSRDSTAG